MAVMITTTLVLLLTALVYWQVSLLLIIPVFLFYGLVEGLFFAAVLFKVTRLYCCCCCCVVAGLGCRVQPAAHHSCLTVLWLARGVFSLQLPFFQEKRDRGMQTQYLRGVPGHVIHLPLTRYKPLGTKRR